MAAPLVESRRRLPAQLDSGSKVLRQADDLRGIARRADGEPGHEQFNSSASANRRCRPTCTARPESGYRAPAHRADCRGVARAWLEPRRAVSAHAYALAPFWEQR